MPTPLIEPAAATDRHPKLARWQRRTIEAVVAAAAFAVWGTLAYKGLFRLLARAEGMVLNGHWLLDAASLVVGVSGSIAGISALWAIGMRMFGRTPSSLLGKPDDGPTDAAFRDAAVRSAARRAARRAGGPPAAT